VITFLTWIPALSVYALFLAWYVNWRGPLRAAEVKAFIDRLDSREAGGGERNDIEAFRRFLEADDGREFFMVNVVRIAPGEVVGPDGVTRPAREVFERYTRHFLPALFARGGHPALAASKVGPYFDAWGVPPDPGWSLLGYMRYRSRRDLAVLVADPRFSGAHDFKFAAMPQTFSFPTQPRIMTLAGPTVTVALVLAVLALLGQCAWLLLIGAGSSPAGA
jgi:hypothetical protein